MAIESRPATEDEKIQIAKFHKIRAEWARRSVSCDGAHPKCPYCKVEHRKVSARSIADDLDFSQGDDGVDGEDETCESCERPFKLKVEFTIEWETSMTDEEFAIEEAKRPDPNQLSIFQEAKS